LDVLEDSEIIFSNFTKTWWDRVSLDFTDATRERWQAIVSVHLVPFFSGQLRAISAEQVADYIQARHEAGAGAGTINLEVGILKYIVKRAVAWEYLSRDPLKDRTGAYVEGLQPLRVGPFRTRYLTEAEVGRLLAACAGDRYLHAFVVVALNSGMRRSEILGLTRATVDWNNALALLPKTKNNTSAAVPLNATAMQALHDLPVPIDEAARLFPYKPRQVSMKVNRAARQANVQNFRLHDSRHHYASHLAMAGVPTRGLQELLRHKSASMTARYSHLSPSYLREAVERVAFGK
jgi:integrase